jgi:hypothetical protein
VTLGSVPWLVSSLTAILPVHRRSFALWQRKRLNMPLYPKLEFYSLLVGRFLLFF